MVAMHPILFIHFYQYGHLHGIHWNYYKQQHSNCVEVPVQVCENFPEKWKRCVLGHICTGYCQVAFQSGWMDFRISVCPWLPEFHSVSDLGGFHLSSSSPYLLSLRWLVKVDLSPIPPKITLITSWFSSFEIFSKLPLLVKSRVRETNMVDTLGNGPCSPANQRTCLRTPSHLLGSFWDTHYILFLVPGWSHPIDFSDEENDFPKG